MIVPNLITTLDGKEVMVDFLPRKLHKAERFVSSAKLRTIQQRISAQRFVISVGILKNL